MIVAVLNSSVDGSSLMHFQSGISVLKEHCHEDFAVLGQFCAKIISLRL